MIPSKTDLPFKNANLRFSKSVFFCQKSTQSYEKGFPAKCFEMTVCDTFPTPKKTMSNNHP